MATRLVVSAPYFMNADLTEKNIMAESTRIKAVLFDVGGVLFSTPLAAIAEVEQDLGLPQGFLGLVFVTGEPDSAFCRLERGELTLSQFFPLFEREFVSVATSQGINPPPGFSASKLFQRIRSSVKPVPAMFRAVHLINKAGFKTGVITNNWIDDTSKQTGHQFLSKHFDIVLQSCLLGVRKPNPIIYQLACQRLGVDLTETVFLDDLGSNLKSARELGMVTVRVRETEEALRELEALLGVRLLEGGEREENSPDRTVTTEIDRLRSRL